MIIPNQFIKLEYDPRYDILVIEWPDMFEHNTVEYHYVLESLVEVVRYYDIKKVLVSAQRQVVDVTNEQYVRIVADFRDLLNTTRLEKLARVGTTDRELESQVREIGDILAQNYIVENFNNLTEAMNWLKV